MERMKLEALAEELTAYYRLNGLMETAYVVADYIEVEINWGDWKHEHLRCKWLTEQLLEMRGIGFDFDTFVTEEDGSDCYSAIHRIRLLHNAT